MDFQREPEHELNRRTDDELIAYIVAARKAGDHDAARTALGVLAFRRLRDLVRRISMKVPADVAEDLAMETLASALKSAFDGEHTGEFVNWLNRIADRRVADYHRRPRPEEQPLPEEHEGEEDIWGEALVSSDFSDAVDAAAVIEQLYEELSETHQRVVDLYVFEGHSAGETAEQVNMSMPDLNPPMTEDNVHQIAKRFRHELRKRLYDGSG